MLREANVRSEALKVVFHSSNALMLMCSDRRIVSVRHRFGNIAPLFWYVYVGWISFSVFLLMFLPKYLQYPECNHSQLLLQLGQKFTDTHGHECHEFGAFKKCI